MLFGWISIALGIITLVCSIVARIQGPQDLRYWKDKAGPDGNDARTAFFLFPSATLVLLPFGLIRILDAQGVGPLGLLWVFCILGVLLMLAVMFTRIPYPIALTPKWFQPLIREHRAKAKEKDPTKETVSATLQSIMNGQNGQPQSADQTSFEEALLVDIKAALDKTSSSDAEFSLYLGEPESRLAGLTVPEPPRNYLHKKITTTKPLMPLQCAISGDRDEVQVGVPYPLVEEGRAPEQYENFLKEQGFLTPAEGSSPGSFSLDCPTRDPLALSRIVLANLHAMGLKPSDVQAYRVDTDSGQVIVPGGLTQSQPGDPGL